MRSSNKIIIGMLVLLLIAFVNTQQTTVLSFLAEKEEEQEQDFMQLTITTKAFDPSLQQAIALAQEKVQRITQLYGNVCEAIVKDNKLCKENIEVGKVSIEPKYEQKKKQTVYAGVTATYEVYVSSQNQKHFGLLVDKFLELEGIKIETIEWQADEEQEEDTFLTEALEQGDELCGQLGLSYQKLISIEEVREEPEPVEEPEPAEEGEEEEQEQEEPVEEEPEEEGPEVTVYRITLQCGKSAKKPIIGKKEAKPKAEKPKAEKPKKGQKQLQKEKAPKDQKPKQKAAKKQAKAAKAKAK